MGLGAVWAGWIATSASASVTAVEVTVEQVEGKPEIEVSITGDPCPEPAITVALDGRALQGGASPTRCEVQQKLNKDWYKLTFTGPAPAAGDHTLEIHAGADTTAATFSMPERPTVKLPATITEAPVPIHHDGAPVTGQLAMRSLSACTASFKAPLRGRGPDYAVTFLPRVCEGKGEVSARLNTAFDLVCDPVVAKCTGKAIWGWTLGERPFALQGDEVIPPPVPAGSH